MKEAILLVDLLQMTLALLKALQGLIGITIDFLLLVMKDLHETIIDPLPIFLKMNLEKTKQDLHQEAIRGTLLAPVKSHQEIEEIDPLRDEEDQVDHPAEISEITLHNHKKETLTTPKTVEL